MITDQFSNAVDEIIAEDSRFERDAYFFVRDALDFTTKSQRRKAAAAGGADSHVTGQQLLDGIRLYALKQYGPMVLTVFEHWNVKRCEDIGTIVFNLISAKVFGKTSHDTIEDFSGGYDFDEAFVEPFRSPRPEPARPVAGSRSRTASAKKSKSA